MPMLASCGFTRRLSSSNWALSCYSFLCSRSYSFSPIWLCLLVDVPRVAPVSLLAMACYCCWVFDILLEISSLLSLSLVISSTIFYTAMMQPLPSVEPYSVDIEAILSRSSSACSHFCAGIWFEPIFIYVFSNESVSNSIWNSEMSSSSLSLISNLVASSASETSRSSLLLYFTFLNSPSLSSIALKSLEWWSMFTCSSCIWCWASRSFYCSLRTSYWRFSSIRDFCVSSCSTLVFKESAEIFWPLW